MCTQAPHNTKESYVNPKYQQQKTCLGVKFDGTYWQFPAQFLGIAPRSDQ